jgi:rhodanese-related sulfurtransferase
MESFSSEDNFDELFVGAHVSVRSRSNGEWMEAVVTDKRGLSAQVVYEYAGRIYCKAITAGCFTPMKEVFLNEIETAVAPVPSYTDHALGASFTNEKKQPAGHPKRTRLARTAGQRSSRRLSVKTTGSQHVTQEHLPVVKEDESERREISQPCAVDPPVQQKTTADFQATGDIPAHVRSEPIETTISVPMLHKALQDQHGDKMVVIDVRSLRLDFLDSCIPGARHVPAEHFCWEVPSLASELKALQSTLKQVVLYGDRANASRTALCAQRLRAAMLRGQPDDGTESWSVNSLDGSYADWQDFCEARGRVAGH